MDLSLNDLICNIIDYSLNDIEMIKKAYNYAYRLHDGQFRQSGEPYIIHPLSVAIILSEMHADVDTICAGLLHDTLEDTDITKDDIIKDFNIEVANLVDGVTKISKLNFSSKDDQNLANTRKIITSITTDVRIIIIKLADRLHNMRTLEFKSVFKQKENAMETMEIYVPLAYYLGAYRIKVELEDLSFKYLYPDKYESCLNTKLSVERESKVCLEEMTDVIGSCFNEHNINNYIKVRTKNIYGIYKKLIEGHKLEDIHDLLCLKVMVDDIPKCYYGLGLVHSIYHPVNDMFKDYICNPKTNMYRSLHTTVFGPQDRLVQTQIRTYDMDKVASFGLCTYFDIKKGNARDEMQKDLKSKYQFFENLVEINTVFGDNKEFVNQVKVELFSDKIYVYTPHGDVIELPKGSTVIDFAYKIHTRLGDTMDYALVNDQLVDPDYELHDRDRVKVIVNNFSSGPKDEWLSKAHTTRAKRKIKEFKKKNNS